MRKFTRLWQLTMILLLSSSVMFAQERLEKGISSSPTTTNSGDQLLEKYSDDQIKELKNARLLDNKELDEKAIEEHLAKLANENAKNSINNAQRQGLLKKDPSPANYSMILPSYAGGAKGSTAWAINLQAPDDFGSCDASEPAASWTSIGNADGWSSYAGDYDNLSPNYYYVIAGDGFLKRIDVTNGNVVSNVGIPSFGGASITGMACDRTTGIMYVMVIGASSDLYTIDLYTAVATKVGSTGVASDNIIEIAIDGTGQMYGWGLDDNSYTINKTTGASTLIGSLGVAISYAQGGNWDPIDDVIYMAAYLDLVSSAEQRMLNTTTGTADSVSTLPGETDAMAFPNPGAIITHDVLVSGVTSPISGVGLTATEAVTVTLYNIGTVAESNIPVSFSFDGGLPVTETFAGPLDPNTSATYTFTATVDASVANTTYTIDACTGLSTDEIPANDCAATYSFVHFAPFDCDWYIVGTDDYGDGWNGASVDIVVNGIIVANFSVPDAGPLTEYFSIWEASTIDVVFNSGSYDYEIEYFIYNNFDEEIFNDGVGGIDPVGTTGIAGTCLPPACADPTITSTGQITETTARGFWTKGDSEALWNLEYGPAGFTPGTGTLMTGLTNPNPLGGDPYYDFSGLSGATYYDWYVQADCGSDVSGWVGPETFGTALPHVSVPVVETFETILDGFNITGNGPGNVVDWVVVDTMAYNGISSGFNVYAANSDNSLLFLRNVDLTVVNAQLSFWHIAKTEGGYDYCYVDISTDGGLTYAPIPAANYLGAGVYNDSFNEDSYPEWGTETTPLADTMWMQEKFNLTPYNTFTDVTFRFRLTSDGSVQRAGWMIDDILIEELACPPVSDVALEVLEPTTATLGWTSLAGMSNVEWDTTGFVQGTGNMLTGVTSPQTFAPLMANTTYDVYIQDDCSGSESDWFLFQFTTSCTECPVGSIPEGEICGDSTNNGCNLVVTTPAYTLVSDGVTICGNVWDNSVTKDTDWFQLDLATGLNKVTIEVSGDVELIVGLLEQTIPGLAGCDNLTNSINPGVYATPCDTTTLEIYLADAGTYYFWLAQRYWTGNVCPGSRYWISWTVEQLTDPLAVIDPTSFDVAVPVDGTASRELSVGNSGEYPLAYSAQIINYGLGAKAAKAVLFTEGFEGTFPPAGWTNYIQADAPGWIQTATSNTGDSALFHNDDNALCDDWMVTPLIDLTTTDMFVNLNFFEKNYFVPSYYDLHEVLISVGSGDPAVGDFVQIYESNQTVSSYALASIDISAYANQSVYIAFHYTGDFSAEWSVDDISIETLSAPTGWLTLDGGSSTSGAVFMGDPADLIAVDFDAAGLALGVYTAEIEVTTNEPASDIVHVLPVTFEVAESYMVSGTLTYDNVSATVMDLVDVSLMDGTTEVATAMTDEFGAFSFSAIDGTYNYMATTTKVRGGTDVGDLNLVLEHITGNPLMGLPFDATDVAAVLEVVDVDDLNGHIDEILGVNLGWIVPDYMFENPSVVVAGADVVQDFKSLCAGDGDGSFIPPNFCDLPTGLTVSDVTVSGGEITWTSLAGLSNIEYGPTGFTLGTGTMMSGVTSPTMVSGAAFDIIDVYVQDDCGGVSQSEWVGPVTFTVPGPGSVCASAVTIPGVPFVVSGLTTCGFGDDYSNADACSSYYMNGDDFVFEYTPAATITVDITLANTVTWVGLFVTEGCPDVGTCVDNATSSTGNPSISQLELTGGVTYYILISTNPTPDCTPFDIGITEYVAPTAIAPPYLEGFDTFLPTDWSEADAGDPTTGPTTPGSGQWTNGTLLTSESARINLYSTFRKDWLISPEFDLSGGSYDAIFDVAVTNWNNGDPDAMGSDDQVQFCISNDGGATWVVLATYNLANQPTNLGLTETIDISAYTGTSVFFAFWADDGSVDDAEDYDFHVDNFKVQ